jgi:hypothetical protein
MVLLPMMIDLIKIKNISKVMLTSVDQHSVKIQFSEILFLELINIASVMSFQELFTQ